MALGQYIIDYDTLHFNALRLVPIDERDSLVYCCDSMIVADQYCLSLMLARSIICTFSVVVLFCFLNGCLFELMDVGHSAVEVE